MVNFALQTRKSSPNHDLFIKNQAKPLVFHGFPCQNLDCPLKRLLRCGKSLGEGTKINIAYNFFLTGPGVPLIIERTSEMKTSDDLRSELCCFFLSGSAGVKSYDSPKLVKWLLEKA